MARYAANLLFHYGIDGRRAARPLCEKRIVVLRASNPRDAVRRAQRYGRDQQTSYRNADGDRFQIRFLGLVDLISLDLSNDTREAYYTMFRTARPERHVRRTDQLSILRPGSETIRSAWWVVPARAARPQRRKRPAAIQAATHK